MVDDDFPNVLKLEAFSHMKQLKKINNASIVNLDFGS